MVKAARWQQWLVVCAAASATAVPELWISSHPARSGAKASSQVASGVIAGRAAPVFTLPDVAGRRRSLAEFRGRPLVLFFFCGCEACHRCAAAWGQVQEAGAIPPDARTLVVFAGESAAAVPFAASVGLDGRRTVLLTDPESHEALAYGALPCPRLFVLDRRGVVRYTNDHRDDAAPDAPAAVLVSHAIDALREASKPVGRQPASRSTARKKAP